MTEKEWQTHNSTYKRLAVQWLNEALCFVSNFVVADSFVLRNRQLLLAANRYLQAKKKASRTNCIFGFCQRSKPKHKKPKEQFLTNALHSVSRKIGTL